MNAMRLWFPLLLILAMATPALAAEYSVTVAPTGASAAWFVLRVVLLSGLLFATVAAFKVPGTGIAETIAVVLLAALLVPSVMAGTAQWYEIVGIVAGIGFLAFEVFVIPGFGATGAIGGLLMLAGLVLVFVPDFRGSVTTADIRNALIVLIGGGVGGIVSVVSFARFLPKLPRANRLILTETNHPPLPGEPQLAVGDIGVALTDLRPGGTMRIAVPGDTLPHRDLSVVCDRGFVTAGERVAVADIEGTKVTVRPESAGLA